MRYGASADFFVTNGKKFIEYNFDTPDKLKKNVGGVAFAGAVCVILMIL